MRTVADGLFHHPDGATAEKVLKRMAEGTTNYNFDDPFKPALDETEQELAHLDAQIDRAEHRLIELRHKRIRTQERLQAQQTAKEHFAETGEIDEVLFPSIESLVEAEAAAEREKIKKAEKFALPDKLKEEGWKADKSIRVTDTEIIVTIRKRRTDTPVDVQQTEKRIAKTIQRAMQPFRADDSRYRRVLRERISTRPQQPKGPPDD